VAPLAARSRCLTNFLIALVVVTALQIRSGAETESGNGWDRLILELVTGGEVSDISRGGRARGIGYAWVYAFRPAHQAVALCLRLRRAPRAQGALWDVR